MCDWWEVIIGLDNGLVPNRQQAITYTNDDPVQLYIHVTLGEDELKLDAVYLVKRQKSMWYVNMLQLMYGRSFA